MQSSRGGAPSSKQNRAGFADVLQMAKEPGAGNSSRAAFDELALPFLAGLSRGHRAAPILATARHVLAHCQRQAGGGAAQPILADYARMAVGKSMMPRVLELCHPEVEQGYAAVLVPYHDNGLFANVLQVLDMVVLAHPSVPVLVDWRRVGAEGHFQYGASGFDLFEHLFDTSSKCGSVARHPGSLQGKQVSTQPGRVNPVFKNMLRGLMWTMPPKDLDALRHAYVAAAAARFFRPSPRILRFVEEACALWPKAATRVVGVHKRLGTHEVAHCQLSQRAPTSVEFITRVRALLADTPGNAVVFLATDDASAADDFQEAFPLGCGVALRCRDGVKRSCGGIRADGVVNEVHRSPCEVSDAEDALVDALCLARCTDLVCMDSNLSIFVTLTNPDIRIHAVSDRFPTGWEETASAPSEPVAEMYKIVCRDAVFVSDGPSEACKLLELLPPGSLVRTSGRAFEGWVERLGGGWLCLASGGWTYVQEGHGTLRRAINSGTLLEPVGQTVPPATGLPSRAPRGRFSSLVASSREEAPEALDAVAAGSGPAAEPGNQQSDTRSSSMANAPACCAAERPLRTGTVDSAQSAGGGTVQPRPRGGFTAWVEAQVAARKFPGAADPGLGLSTQHARSCAAEAATDGCRGPGSRALASVNSTRGSDA